MVILKMFRLLFIRNIKTSINRFLSIASIVALGVSFLAGLTATRPDMQLGANLYYYNNNIYDVNIKSTFGLTEEDLTAIRQNINVEFAMPAYVVDKIVQTDEGESYVSRIYGTDLSLFGTDEYIGRVELLLGRMPQNANECVLITTADYGISSDITVGSTLLVVVEETDEEEAEAPDEEQADSEFDFDDFSAEIPEARSEEILLQREFTVVGVARSPIYYSDEAEASQVGSGRVNLVLYVQQECFSSGVYTDIFVRINHVEDFVDYFTDEYTENVDNAVDNFDRLEAERVEIRYEEVREDAYAELAEAQQKLDDARAELEEELARARRELADAESELREGQNKLNQKKNEYIEALNQYIDAAAQLDAAKAQLAAMKPYIDMLLLMQSGGTPLSPTELTVIAQYNAGMQQVADTETLLWSVAQQLVLAKEQLDDAQEEINQGHEDLHQAQIDFAEAERKANEALANAQEQINDAYEDINTLDMPEWYYFTLEDNAAYSGYYRSTNDMGAIAKVFPVFFFLVAMLVSLTTMTRMVEEQRTQIGILKSLGYTDTQVMLYYLIYGGFASAVGCIVGMWPGFKIIPTLISSAYALMYRIPETPTPFHLSIAIVISVAIISAIVVTSYYACRNVLKNKPASLLVPPAPRAGKRIFLEHVSLLWKRLSFTQKVTARNLFRYKKRFVMTVIGVAGCTALLVTGFGIKDSISDIVDKQFGEVFLHNFIVAYDESNAFYTDEEALSFLTNEEYVQSFLPVCTRRITISNGTQENEVILLLPADLDAFPNSVNLHNRKTGEVIDLDENGAVLTEKVAEQMGISVGDSITVENADGETALVTVTGISENYVDSYLYVGNSVFGQIYTNTPEYFTLYIKTNPNATYTDEDYSAIFLESEHAVYVMAVDSLKISFTNALSSIDSVVYVIIIFSGLLALIVLYNLTNINIGEREKELATLKVLGFYNKEVSSYIFKEVYLLSFIGALVGLVLGTMLHRFVIFTVEISMAMFGRTIYLPSYLISIAITMLFTISVSLVMQRRLRKIDMVESMKAGE